MINKILFLVFAFVNTSVMAQTFSSNNINYTITDIVNFKVEVGNNSGFVGVANIPNTVLYNGHSYAVTTIGYYAFQNCTGLTSVTIPNSVSFIYPSAFSHCTGLTSVTYPNSINHIGASIFSYCSSLTSFNIPDSVTYIGDNAFSYCSSLTSITIPNSVTGIWGSAFRNCTSLTSVTIPNSVNYFGTSAFLNCSSLTSVTIPYGVTNLEGYLFAGCSSLTSVTIPNSITIIEYSAFYGCTGLTSVTIPNSVNIIRTYAFSNCTGLTSVTIPNSVTSIESSVFANCSGLTTVNCDRITPLAINADVFQGVNQSTCALNVNDISAAAYMAAPVWRNFNPINGVLSNNSFVKNNFSIYPNPSNDIINITLQHNLQLEKVTIYDQLGKVVKTSTNTIISTSELAKGSYFVEVFTNKGKAIKLLLLE